MWWLQYNIFGLLDATIDAFLEHAASYVALRAVDGIDKGWPS